MFETLAVHWSMNPEIFSIGPVSIRWYSLLFISGFILGWFIFRWFFRREFDVADEMNLCGRNVAFSVWKGMNLIEYERIGKKIRISDFELKYS